jgi:hypothetical protein
VEGRPAQPGLGASDLDRDVNYLGRTCLFAEPHIRVVDRTRAATIAGSSTWFELQVGRHFAKTTVSGELPIGVARRDR